jgi:hypothetical protein
MFEKILPRTIDNTYRGHRAGLLVFGALLFMRLAMSVGSMFNGVATLTTADGIPLASYSPAAARTIVALFAIVGLNHFLSCLLCILVLSRYRAMVPFMFLLLLVEHLSRKLILQLMPISRVGEPPASAINLLVLSLMIAGLVLSLWTRHKGPA